MVQLFAPSHLQSQGLSLATKNSHLTGYLFATSGTTGAPKWILHSQANLDWCAQTVNQLFDCGPKDTWGLALPTFHVGGFCLSHRAKLARGSLVCFPQKWNGTDFRNWVEAEKVTLTSLVPTQIFDLVNANLPCPPHLRLVIVGGEHCDESLFEKARELGWPLVTSYGMTETAGLVAASHLKERELYGIEGWEFSTTAEGCLCINGPGLFEGYLTEQGLLPTEKPFLTKDLVSLSHKRLTFKGRSDDQVKIMGELVDLSYLRKALAEVFPEHHTTIIALPDERRGHELLPVLTTYPHEPDLSTFENWNKCLPPFSRCREPIILSHWPRTPIGKTDLQAIIEQATEERSSLLQNPPSRDKL